MLKLIKIKGTGAKFGWQELSVFGNQEPFGQLRTRRLVLESGESVVSIRKTSAMMVIFFQGKQLSHANWKIHRLRTRLPL